METNTELLTAIGLLYGKDSPEYEARFCDWRRFFGELAASIL